MECQNILHTQTKCRYNKVSFIDGLGNVIKNTIQETTAKLSNTDECSLILKLYDDSNSIRLKR